MNQLILYILISCTTLCAAAQSPKTELYDLIKKLLSDSTGYENVGDWTVGQPKKSSIKWMNDRIEMSDDTSINFFRKGTVDITVKGHSFMQAGQPVKWNIMLKGPRMGYTSFSIISSTNTEMKPAFNIDSVFGKKNFIAKLLKSCDARTVTGYYYYELKLPKKDIAFIKLSWISLDGKTAMRIDCYDNWSRYAVKLDCPR